MENNKKTYDLTAVIEQDENGVYIGRVPDLPGCHTYANSLQELYERLQEVTELYLEAKNDLQGVEKSLAKFVGLYQLKLVA